MLEAWGNLGSCVYDVLGISSDREVVWFRAQVSYWAGQHGHLQM